ncbi:hypothetical protein SYNTR_2165 [Candidatus Syntrophocurvum alkaliphilum]|uniref:NYN domain-containing protein n=1 Tax=Candidatus Syntrophocurvum alkaliphilum TaxID=2293317 RepID=A0A6I6DJI3_9FIRM|nr:NYN domain-containing protein [Candidatus Syntrophocurvum alkaliphilum]QGU00759.1 hypothetical protein SYNTR_2165 [Candidatus Syntrophocurvum alkaliphilum]
MKAVLIVDGYNIINSWSELNELKNSALELAREKLIDIMINYAGYLNYKIYIVFDGQSNKGQEKVYYSSEVEVVFSNSEETADDIIERMVFNKNWPDEMPVFVATSDWAEQTMIFSKGAYRISALELKKQIERINHEIKSHIAKNINGWRIDTVISSDVLDKLEKIRRNEK